MNLSHSAEQAIITASNKASIFGGGAAAVTGVAQKASVMDVMGMYASEIASLASLGGLFIAVTGLLISFYFSRRRDQREERESQWRMDQNRRSGSDRRQEN